MKTGALKKQKPLESRIDRVYGIQTYGENNSFPQQVQNIVLGSGTGFSCINVLTKFLKGRGFKDPALYDLVINRKGQTMDNLLYQVAIDYAMFGGFYLHVNYNANFKISEINWVPFENARLGEPDESGKPKFIALHWDWGRQFQQIKQWKATDIHKINLFNPKPEIIQGEVEIAGGWDNYRGQIYYFFSNMAGNYPVPSYFPALTDMSTEQGVANLSYRNARNNFLPAGMLIDIINEDQNKNQKSETEADLLAYQGDEEACKIIYTSVSSKEEIPEFIEFRSENYDKEFSVTDESCRSRIGRAFNQPPILRAEDVGSNFGADALQNAYNYYNSVTDVDRANIEQAFKEIFTYWGQFEYTDFSILRLTYNEKNTLYEKLGDNATNKIIELVNNSVDKEKTKKILIFLYGLTPEEADMLLL